MTDNRDDKTRLVSTHKTGKSTGNVSDKDGNTGNKQSVNPTQGAAKTPSGAGDDATVYVGSRVSSSSPNPNDDSTVVTSRPMPAGAAG
ncbi:hypothetical protein, partial [Thalassolituus sp.]|uniref:hypothetical protein n=1 Tax=Thalassolituus sp. TaxID=2030822 RepID=UPI002A7FBB93